MNNKFYITTSIAYASKKPHVGNTYEVVFADAIARFKRLKGFDVFFCTGTDEHGLKIEELARKNSTEPQKYVDDISQQIKCIWDKMGVSYDCFIRTTNKSHVKAVRDIFRKLYENGDIYKSKYEGWYCVPCESFWTDGQLIDGKCPDCAREVRKTKEDAYFFKTSKYVDRLVQYIKNNMDFIAPKSRENEIVNNFLKPGLQDLCVSRNSFKWGISVDFDPDHVVYVWLDALVNYITALGYDIYEPGQQFKKFWPADLHIIGKDILRFHTIYWPMILMALDLPMPKRIFGHPWLLAGESKMSKSVGNVMYADDLCELFSVDSLRFYLLSAMPYAHDGSITYKNIISTFNSDLANTLGNLVKRTFDMIHKYFDGVLPEPDAEGGVDDDLRSFALESVEKYENLMDECKVSEAVFVVMSLARRCNKYIDETAPWLLAKTDESRKRLKTILYNLAESIRFIGVMLLPIMPKVAGDILDKIHSFNNDFSFLKSFGILKANVKIEKSDVLFQRIDESKKLDEIKKFNENVYGNSTKLPENVVTIEDFSKVDLKVFEVLDCEKIEKSRKLLKLRLSGANEIRQVVSGIAKWYEPCDLIGKKVVVVSNLKPVKLCGEESQGMILAADVNENEARVLFVDESVPNGSSIH